MFDAETDRDLAIWTLPAMSWRSGINAKTIVSTRRKPGRLLEISEQAEPVPLDHLPPISL
jgi:hypothetical protein